MTKVGAVVAACAGFLSVGCGAYEPEPEYPQQYQYVAPTPPTAEELAAQQAARQQQQQENREIVVGADGDEYSDTDPSALTEFKPALEGHGTWVEDSTYGTVWVPSSAEVGTDFQPYVTAGHWTYSEDTDYVWVSDYSWGWAPFHYGRWVYLPGHGWSWIPGRRYAGAWVVWRTGPAGYGYVGWAPMGPSWYWWHGAAIGWSFGWYHHHDYYVYCPHSHFYGSTYSPTYVVRGAAAREHYGRTADYQPAQPGVGGGGGGQRVVANPGVGGSGDGRVVANPGVGGTQRYLANPGVRGPRPDEIGANKDLVVAPPKDNAGLAKAQTYSQPKTAMAVGGAAPAHLNPGPAMNSGTNAGSVGVNPRGPATSGFVPPPSVRTAPSFADRNAGVASAPPRYANPSPTFRPSPGPSTPSYSAPTPSYSSPPSSGFSGARTAPPSSSVFSARPSSPSPNPAFRSSPPPTFRSSPPPTTSFRSSPSFGGSSPTFRSSPSVSSGSSFSRSPSVSSGSSFGGARSSAPSGFRSSPSVSAPRSGGSFSSSPVRSAPSRSTSSSFRRR